MKELQNYASLPVKYEIQNYEDDRFKKVKIYVMHDKMNLNYSYFDFTSIENAKDSIKNIPILAFVKKSDGVSGGDDFAGHEWEIIMSSDDFKVRYLGRPIGVIPAENNNYHYETFDDKTYVVVEGYVWTDYANEAMDILSRDTEKGQSMEIRVDDAEWNDELDAYKINNYRYLGLCILGDDYTPAMTGAKVKLIESEESKFNATFHQMIEELSNSLKEYSAKVGENMEEVLEDEVLEEENQEFEETESVEEVSNEEETSEESTEEESSEEVVEEESSSEGEFTETVDDEFIDLRTLLQSKEFTISELNTNILNLQNKCKSLEDEIVELRKYKSDIEAEKSKSEKIDLFNEFSIGLTEEEMKSVKDKMDEMSVNEIRIKLNEIFTIKNLNELKKHSFSTNSDNVKIDIKRKGQEKNRYAV